MYHSDIIIKHRNKSHLFWGLDKDTNEVVYISQVKSRGLHCNCRCAHCGEDFVAKLGNVNKHHFAHKSNYECVYSNEIAVYLLTKKLLQTMQTMLAPTAGFYFGHRRDTVVAAHEAAIGKVYYQCDSQQYPPLLIADIGGMPTRIILAFEKYYTKEDFILLNREARFNGWNCMMIELPRIVDESSVSIALLKMSVKGCESGKHWIYHKTAASALKELRTLAITPAPVLPENQPSNFECPLHRKMYKDRYYAQATDCNNCPYNLAEYPKCMCLAHVGVQQYQDLQKPLDVRLKKIDELRTAHDFRHRINQKKANRLEIKKTTATQDTCKPIIQTLSKEEMLEKGWKEIEATFNPYSNEIAFDSFGRRWVKCKVCNRILPSEECPMYGGCGTTNLGICYDCSRK